MFTTTEIEKILRAENRRNRKLTRDEIELILDRDLTDEEWNGYDINGVSIIQDEDNRRDYETYSVEITKQRDGVLKDTTYTLRLDNAIPYIIVDVSNDLKNAVSIKGLIKFKIIAEFNARNPLNESVVKNFAIEERWDIVSNKDVLVINEVIFDHLTSLRNQFEDRNEGESGLVYESISRIITKIAEAPNNPGGSYIITPKWITNKKATINVKNDDNECFKWSVLAALHHK